MFRKKGGGISGCNKITPANWNVILTTTIKGKQRSASAAASPRRKHNTHCTAQGYRAGKLLSIASQNPMTLGSHNTRSGR